MRTKSLKFEITKDTQVSEIVLFVEKMIEKFHFAKLKTANQEEKRAFFSLRLKILKELCKIHTYVKRKNVIGLVFFELLKNKNISLNTVILKEGDEEHE
ncbi:MAG: hypothetical protein NZZ41_06025 [Candidatus Dojkabacteria bacterium]|nr:hypothetical protein [Candidatus Dojkabacteria bacterium]